MNRFDLEICYPVKINGSDTTQLNSRINIEILNQFDLINWRRYRSIMLELNSVATSFTLTNLSTQQTIRLSLVAGSQSEQLKFNLESDIQILVHQKDLFGFMKRKTKDYISFDQISLEQARASLGLFLSDELNVLEDRYRDTLHKPVQAA